MSLGKSLKKKMEDFYLEYQRIGPVRRSFADIVSAHALQMHKFVQGERNVQLGRINEEWIEMLTYRDYESEFGKLTDKLITRYTDALCKFVLGGTFDDDELPLSTFFEALGSGNCRSQWVAYTSSVMQMSDAMVRYGRESPIFYRYSAACIRTGRALGMCLDQIRNRVK